MHMLNTAQAGQGCGRDMTRWGKSDRAPAGWNGESRLWEGRHTVGVLPRLEFGPQFASACAGNPSVGVSSSFIQLPQATAGITTSRHRTRMASRYLLMMYKSNPSDGPFPVLVPACHGGCWPVARRDRPCFEFLPSRSAQRPEDIGDQPCGKRRHGRPV